MTRTPCSRRIAVRRATPSTQTHLLRAPSLLLIDMTIAFVFIACILSTTSRIRRSYWPLPASIFLCDFSLSNFSIHIGNESIKAGIICRVLDKNTSGLS